MPVKTRLIITDQRPKPDGRAEARTPDGRDALVTNRNGTPLEEGRPVIAEFEGVENGWVLFWCNVDPLPTKPAA